MDLNALREAAVNATAKALYDRHGVVLDDDSDEWEDEYRKQFAALKQRYGSGAAAPVVVRTAPTAAALQRLPELRGTPEEIKWGASIRGERLAQVPNEVLRTFLVQTWPRAKQWIDTRDVPLKTLVQRLAPQYEEWRKKRNEAAQTRKAEADKKAAEVAAYKRRLEEAHITPEGLVEMVDASDRFPPAPIAAKLAEIDVEGRHLRLYETADPNLLLIKEKRGPLQLDDYAIERDEGLVGDLKLFAAAP